MRGEQLGNAARMPPLFRFDFFEEAYERIRVIARLIHILQTQKVGLAFSIPGKF